MAVLLLLTTVAIVMLSIPSLAEASYPCKYGTPQMNNIGEPVFCGRGPTRENCKPGYECKIDPADRYAVCCPLARCPFGQVWNTCGSACTATCREPNPICIKVCVARCKIPHDYPILRRGRCVRQEDCPPRYPPLQTAVPFPLP